MTVPLLRTPREVEAWLADTTHTLVDKAAAYDKAEQRLGVREARRLWEMAGAIAAVRVLRTVNQQRWCPTCRRRVSLLPNGDLVAHTHGYDRVCPGGTPLTWNPNNGAA